MVDNKTDRSLPKSIRPLMGEAVVVRKRLNNVLLGLFLISLSIAGVVFLINYQVPQSYETILAIFILTCIFAAGLPICLAVYDSYYERISKKDIVSLIEELSTTESREILESWLASEKPIRGVNKKDLIRYDERLARIAYDSERIRHEEADAEKVINNFISGKPARYNEECSINYSSKKCSESKAD